jgi:Ca-activated chloride channel homolog
MKTRIAVMMLMMLMSLENGWAAFDRSISGQVISLTSRKPIAGVLISLRGTAINTRSNQQGEFTLMVHQQTGTLVFSMAGFKKKEIPFGKEERLVVVLQEIGEPEITRKEKPIAKTNVLGKMGAYEQRDYASQIAPGIPQGERLEIYNTEEYDAINENIFLGALHNPLSTFSIDVDAASYSNIRRFINQGQQPPKDAVRIEEMINYFDYDYPEPKGNDPFAIYTEISSAPWNPKHKLVKIGLQGKRIPTANLPAANIVFLLDVSGSMNEPNKLPLLKSSFKMLVDQLREQDRVAIVVYAGAAGLVLPSTPGNEKRTILKALDDLQAGGSTAGGEGIRLAYEIGKQNFIKGGNNRIILATDGDFNVGESSNAAMERLIEEKRNDGIYLTVLGFGMGNYKDSKMETLADKGNGNYGYIDTIEEARKILVKQFGGTLFTIAKDVKLQIEFNPAKVQAYRLIGYENRMLKNEDFNNDKKDAGELGSGHTVTALYEIIPVGVESPFFKTDELKYQKTEVNKAASKSPELMTVKFRYKDPEGEISKLLVHPLIDNQISLTQTSENFRWVAAVAGFGMKLRDSEYVKDFSYGSIESLAEGSRGKDPDGYRIEFIKMIKSLELLTRQ